MLKVSVIHKDSLEQTKHIRQVQASHKLLKSSEPEGHKLRGLSGIAACRQACEMLTVPGNLGEIF